MLGQIWVVFDKYLLLDFLVIDDYLLNINEFLLLLGLFYLGLILSFIVFIMGQVLCLLLFCLFLILCFPILFAFARINVVLTGEIVLRHW